MKKYLAHPSSRSQIDNVLSNVPHALLINGASGIGKLFAAQLLLAQVLATNKQLEVYPFYLHIVANKGVIGVDQIRNIQTFLQLKTTGKNDIRRGVIIEDAHNMTTEAQNALLKSLEEPPKDTIIILTAIPTKAILPTIYSRVQQIELKIPTYNDARAFFDFANEAEFTSAYNLSGGLPGLLSTILTDPAHPLLENIQWAKRILAKNSFDRLLEVETLTKSQSSITGLLNALKQIATIGLKNAANKNNQDQTARWNHILLSAHEAEEQVSRSVNTKILLTDLLLNL